MNDQLKQTRLLLRLFFLAVVSLSCTTVTIAVDREQPAAESAMPVQPLGFDFVDQTPEFPEGDISASLHLFLHKYRIPGNGFITGVSYLNDSDTIVESFDLLILRPDTNGWKVIHRIGLSDDSPPAQTGVTVVTLPSSLSVQKNDIFAHWQSGTDGAIPLNANNTSSDGFSIGRYGFRSADIEVGQHIDKDGFTGQRDYFINITFSATP